MTDWNDRADPAVRSRLSRECEQCGAKVSQVCVNLPINTDPLTGRIVHFGR